MANYEKSRKFFAILRHPECTRNSSQPLAGASEKGTGVFSSADEETAAVGVYELDFQQIHGGQQIRILDFHTFGERNSSLTGVVAVFF